MKQYDKADFTPAEISVMNQFNGVLYPKFRWKEEVHPVGESKVKRNDPCPCGSGKKYKKCCG